MKVVITVPHAACPPDPSPHRCDFAAPEIARALHRALPGSELIESEVHRDPDQAAADGGPGSDQNRPWRRRDTRFSERLEAALAREPRLLVDVHSFPEGAWNYDVVILESGAPDLASRSLYAALVWAGVHVALSEGSSLNAIVVEARAAGAEAVLVEFGERASRRDERDRAISATVAWVEARLDPVRPL